MRASVWIFLVVVTAPALPARAQPVPTTREDAAISKLLSAAVPAADWKEHLNKRKQAGWVPPPLPALAPADTAPLDQLIASWRTDYGWAPHMGRPSAVVRERLLAACEEQPVLLANLAGRFSASQEGVTERIQKLHARLAAASAQDEEARNALPKARLWLMTEAGLFRDELKAAAEKYFTTPDDADAMAAFEALQKLEPGAAQALLLQAAAGPPAARGTALLRLHARKDAPPGPWREGLQALVTSREAPGLLHAAALKALGSTEWPEKEAWVLGLFKDASLRVVREHEHDKDDVVAAPVSGAQAPLASLVSSAPDFWVPKVIPLVGNPDRAVHENAVRALAQFHLENRREDALRALLPWLSDPQWAENDASSLCRLRLLQTLEDMRIPESVPGLLWALEHDAGYEKVPAAVALAHHHATQAVPMLRKIISNEADMNDRKRLVAALLRLDGMTVEEQARALERKEALALDKQQSEALEREEMLPFSPGSHQSAIAPGQRLLITAGLVLADSPEFHTAALADALARRIEDLRHADKAELAEALDVRVSLWNTPASARLLMARLRTGRVTAEWLWDLCRADTLPVAELKALQDLPANAAAVVALLLNDEARIKKILDAEGTAAQALLLACARVRRMPLPLEKVAPLLESKHILCARGAERYLEAEDSPQARALLLRRFKGEARILGARMNFDPGHHSYGDLEETQDMLRRRVLTAGQPLEILALLSAGYWGDNGQVWIEISGDKAVLINDQGGQRFRTRELLPAELAELRGYLAQNQVDDLPPEVTDIYDGIQYEYTHLTAEGGRRVFMNNPGSTVQHFLEQGEAVPADQNDSVYSGLVNLFEKLVEDKSKLTVAYRIADTVKGLRIVIQREQQVVEAVMKQEGILTVHKGARHDRQGHWVAVGVDGVPLPQSLMSGPALKLHDAGFTEHLAVDDYSANTSWLTNAAGGQLRASQRKKDDVNGLWVCRQEQEPELIVKGEFGTPVASQDGRWAVMARMGGPSWAVPNDMVRVNLATHEILSVKLAAADNCGPVIRLPHSGRVLVSRVRDPHAPGIEPEAGPEKKEYHLLDPATGTLERVTGEFRPLEDQTWRPLQPTGEPDVVWAAVPREDKEEGGWHTSIGRYDLRRFTFTKLIEIPHIYFTSMDLWVDEDSRQVFLAVNGDLLAFPLPEEGRAQARKPVQ